MERGFPTRGSGLFDRLAADAPDVPAYRLDLAGTLRQLGTVLFKPGTSTRSRSGSASAAGDL